MIHRTQKKLREAQFFLAELERESSATDVAVTAEKAEFYLSAFFAAARSVTLVLAAEEPSNYQEWMDTWRESRTEEERRLLSRFTSARNRAVKRETPIVREDLMSTARSASLNDVPIGVRMFWEEEDYQFPVEPRIWKGRLSLDHHDVEEQILPLCRKYAELLADLVCEFAAAHP